MWIICLCGQCLKDCFNRYLPKVSKKEFILSLVLMIQSINQYVFQDFTRILLTGYMVNHSNNPRTDIGKPVFMTDLPMQLVQVI